MEPNTWWWIFTVFSIFLWMMWLPGSIFFSTDDLLLNLVLGLKKKLIGKGAAIIAILSLGFHIIFWTDINNWIFQILIPGEYGITLGAWQKYMGISIGQYNGDGFTTALLFFLPGWGLIILVLLTLLSPVIIFSHLGLLLDYVLVKLKIIKDK